ncbi:MAG: lysophospholipid acyltransferase family protein [Rhodospirillaceae bacterium]|jgi:hypothetical protein|nr:lysophospholipid acyltransferase family protein [Rhodospirillaceae bacterium]MBT5300110.1 lysophospholipid acyltransferase family protein [Rhodospirillaceae bacterium]MBT6608118.1 lysophospholipid acyltransferase family protein [Rhodospirillaceae bacterium]MBT7248432.1 lysophospholipid acyltransferase family protein [Rhodospirillaceae bacterium]
MALKKIIKSEGFRKILCRLGALYIRLVHFTGRWQVVRGETAATYWQQNKPFILCFWHGRLLMMPYCWDLRKQIHLLISHHRDGQLIANTVAGFGFAAISGSTSKGGAQALRTMVKTLKAGDWIAIAPDGPRGPRMRASDGIVSVARLAGVPIIPAAYSMNRGRILKSWDRFLIAWPFGQGVIVWGEPIEVPRDADTEMLETIRLHVEDSLNQITREADEMVRREPVEPGSTVDIIDTEAPIS